MALYVSPVTRNDTILSSALSFPNPPPLPRNEVGGGGILDSLHVCVSVFICPDFVQALSLEPFNLL